MNFLYYVVIIPISSAFFVAVFFLLDKYYYNQKKTIKNYLMEYLIYCAILAVVFYVKKKSINYLAKEVINTGKCSF